MSSDVLADGGEQCERRDDLDVRGLVSLITMYNEKIDALRAMDDAHARESLGRLIRKRDELVSELTGLTFERQG